MSAGRGRGRIVRRVSSLDHRLHSQQIGVHFAFRVRTEESGQRMSHRAGYRVIQELDLYLCGAILIWEQTKVCSTSLTENVAMKAPSRARQSSFVRNEP